MKKRILFITQDLGRTGSEMVLWYLLNNLDKDQYSIYVLCMKKGELFDLLPDHIGKEIFYKSSPNWYKRAFRGLLKVLGKNAVAVQVDRIMRHFKADIWYVNTVVIPDVFEASKNYQVKVVTHVHELPGAFALIKGQALKSIFSYSDVCIGCSEIVCEKIADFGHPDIRLQHSFIDASTIQVDADRIAQIKKKLGVLPGDFVWVVSGATSYMKGIDQVLPILEHFKDEPIKIIWIGKQLNTGLDFYVQHIAELKYPGKLLFTGALSEDYYNYMSVANGFLLLSREESFSLVMLEAAYLGIPIVAFNIGIVPQFLQKEMGIVIDNWSMVDLLTGMREFYEHRGYDVEKLKSNALKYDVQQQLPKFEALLNNVANSL
ncbi:glycosyltransferase family 4 protein [Pedobacter gandavensis]|uniref:glycosyltransferase family 4 protein n=1 Tax=Pedobacter gandavensis TaxID=2679963 RepID=UPI00292DA0BA|nr:glycosyltransferase family 4 protein [Pedobacter gandavensis]